MQVCVLAILFRADSQSVKEELDSRHVLSLG